MPALLNSTSIRLKRSIAARHGGVDGLEVAHVGDDRQALAPEALDLVLQRLELVVEPIR